jgi:L-fuconolactonase
MTAAPSNSAAPEAPRPAGDPHWIDAHNHFWRFEPGEYRWIDDSMSVLRRDYLPGDLAPLLRASGVRATVAVQARQTLEETEWLLSLADANAAIAAVVGWVPLASPRAREVVGRLAQSRKLRGVRHVVQDEEDPHFLERPDFNAGIGVLAELGLVYDLLIVERQLPSAVHFVDRHPDQVFVLDHAAKPRIREGEVEPWRAHVRELARRPNVYCKLSGLVTEAAGGAWTVSDLRPYAETVLEVFGPSRVMFGSDWPVCLLASPYERWVETVRALIAALTPAERAQVEGGTARRAYRL